MSTSCSETGLTKRVIIVGAGIAGIAAAREICKDDRFNVVILEASNRAGGRMFTRKIDNTPVEFGATFIHGAGEHNVIYQLAKHYGMISDDRRENPEMWDKSTLSAVLTNGEAISSEVVMKYWNMFSNLADDIEGTNNSSTWASMYNDLYSYLVAEFTKRSSGDALDVAKTPPYVKSMFDTFVNWLTISEGGNHCRGIGINGSYRSLPGDREVRFENIYSYGYLIQKLVDTLPDCIHCNTEVLSINTENNPALITCKNGCQYEADHVIVTVPLGVLKKRCLDENLSPNEQSLFIPALPAEKQIAIRSIGFAQVGKVVLQFDQEITSKYSLLPLMILWRPDDKHDPVINKKFPWANELFLLERIQNSNLYESWVTGSAVACVEQASKEEIIEAFTYILSKVFKHHIPKIVDVHMHKWQSDPLFNGCYTVHLADVNTSANITKLREPLNNNQVLFAGEATTEEYYSTVHGAYLTGIREAKRLMEFV
ncbi:peroxisomal N(1)-acetyl-spermine/spermidine oxidase-like [Dysidea avara]|uniref:peroxisomal N(1)-acetyl-spermine/spermidine oxidase-like n=1 Tax=Dysidea avara TaxID=196820 RepID=UPI003323AB74